MKILVCDDDQVYVDEITEMIQKLITKEDNIIIKGLSDERKIKNEVKINSYDLAILDIKMGNVDGIKIARKLIRMNNACLVMFVSNYKEFVQDAFNLNNARANVFQYLYKPIDYEKFVQSFYKALNRYQHLNRIVEFKTSDGKIECHPFDVMYLETHYTDLKIVTEKKMYRSNIKNYKDCKNVLNGYCFIKTHQSYYVNLEYVQSVQKDSIILYNDKVLPISIARYQIVKEAFQKFLLTGGIDDDDYDDDDDD